MTRKEEQIRKAMLHYLEGSIHPEELEALNQVVESDPAARRDLAELMLQDALLTKVSQESEFFELDEARPVPPAAVSCRTSRIMKVTRRAPHADPPPAVPSTRRVAMAAAAILFTVSVAMAVKVLQPPGPGSQPATTTLMPIAPAAPAEAAPLPAEPAVEAPAKTVVQTPAAPKAAPSKAKPVAKPKTSTARKEGPEPKTTTTVPEGFLTLPSGSKLPPPSPSKPAPKLPPKQPPQK